MIWGDVPNNSQEGPTGLAERTAEEKVDNVLLYMLNT
jgi:hypothetical protein